MNARSEASKKSPLFAVELEEFDQTVDSSIAASDRSASAYSVVDDNAGAGVVVKWCRWRMRKFVCWSPSPDLTDMIGAPK
jgi:hypothetical protein